MNISKSWLWVLVIIVVLILIWVAWQYGIFSQLITKKETPLSSRDTTDQIDKDLNSVDVGNPDQDLKLLDTDLNKL